MRIIFFFICYSREICYTKYEQQTKIEKHGKRDQIEKQSNLDVVKMEIQEMAKEQFIVDVVVVVDTIIINMLCTHASHTKRKNMKTITGALERLIYICMSDFTFVVNFFFSYESEHSGNLFIISVDLQKISVFLDDDDFLTYVLRNILIYYIAK